MTTSRLTLTRSGNLRSLALRATALITGLLISITSAHAGESGRLGAKSAYRPATARGQAGYFPDGDSLSTRPFRDMGRDDFRRDNFDRDDFGRDDFGRENIRDDYRDGFRNDFRDESRTNFRDDYRDRDDDLFSHSRTRRNDYSSHRALPWRDQADDLFGTGSRRDRSYSPERYYSEPDLGAPSKVPRTFPRLPARDDLPKIQTDPLPSIQDLISRRYQDPAVLRFIGGLTPERGIAAYAEILNLIATRHIAPPNPGQLAQRGIQNITEALRNPAFAQANRMSGDGRQAAYFQQTMEAQLRQRPMQRAEDAVAVLQIAMQAGQQQLGLAPGVVATEFIYGAMESLDRFSAFMPPETVKSMNQQLGESVVGIGVQIEKSEEAVAVVKVLPGGSAQQAGLQKGDLIVSVDGRPLQGDLDSATSLIAGPEGTSVTLAVVRNGRGPTPMQLMRRSVELHSVNDVQMLDASAGIGYMKLDTFAASSAKEMEQALWTLHQQGMRSLVLDLREDPGGLLTAAVEISNLFLPSGTIVSTRGRTPSDNTTETATQPQTWKVPLVVLVDENSASASEILAAAIQDNGRGLIVGRRTYGKGTVQTLFPLQSVSGGLRLTTAKFYSPSGREMAGAGVQPDVPVPATSSNVRSGTSATDHDIAAAVDVARREITGGNSLSRR